MLTCLWLKILFEQFKYKLTLRFLENFFIYQVQTEKAYENESLDSKVLVFFRNHQVHPNA